jgi:hypothetical protein
MIYLRESSLAFDHGEQPAITLETAPSEAGTRIWLQRAPLNSTGKGTTMRRSRLMFSTFNEAPVILPGKGLLGCTAADVIECLQ